MRALVLSGGGARGAYEAGVIAGLHAKGEQFDLVCGTSIGALNGAYVASNLFDDLAATWHGIAAQHVITYDPIILKIRSLAADLVALGHDPVLRRIPDLIRAIEEYRSLGSFSALTKLMGAIAPTQIESVIGTHLGFGKLASNLIIAATNLSDGSSDAFYRFAAAADGAKFANNHDKGAAHALNEQNFLSAVRASAAIPFAFAPVDVLTESATFQYVDGGVANNTPIGQAIDAGADDVTVIFMDPLDNHAPQAIGNLADVGLQCFGIMQQRILDQDVAAAKRVNAAIDAGSGGTGSRDAVRFAVNLREIRPKAVLPLTVLQFDRQDLIDEAYQIGLGDA